MSNYCASCEHLGSQHVGGGCEGEVTDLYGTWKCVCPQFEKDSDD